MNFAKRLLNHRYHLPPTFCPAPASKGVPHTLPLGRLDDERVASESDLRHTTLSQPKM